MTVDDVAPSPREAALVAEIARLRDQLAGLTEPTPAKKAVRRKPAAVPPVAPGAGITLAHARERDAIWRISAELIGIVDQDSKWVAINPAWTPTLGWSEADVVGQSVDWLEHPDDRARTAVALAQLKDGEPPVVIENRFRTTQGDWRTLCWRVVCSHGVRYGIAQDVTQERAREQALHDSMDFTRLTLSAMSGVGVWTYDVPTDQFVCDSGIAALYGLDPQQGAAGISRDDFLANVHPDDMPALRLKMGGGLVTPGDLEMEYRIRHPDGKIRWVLSRGHTYFDDRGVAVRRTGVGVDMTKQRLLEQQLRQSQKMEAVGQLTGGVAHDFNNLLAGITGSLALLKLRISQGRYDELDRFIGAAQGAATRAAALTHRLLAFSRRQPLDPKPTNVNAVIRGMEELILRTVGPAVTIDVIVDETLWPALIDANQLENALLNLCINARDAMPGGGVISIETANVTLSSEEAEALSLRPGDYLSLNVTDTGTGMTPDVVAHAFDPFFTTKPSGQGTGLGLSMTYGFIRQSDGQIRIHSVLDEGTAMRIYLPRHGAPVEPLIKHEGTPAQAARRETILIVDDEPSLRMLIVEVLNELGYATLEAGDGAAALQVLRSNETVDLMITDVGLPAGLNGRQLAEAGRVLRPDIQVLFITGYSEESVNRDLLDAGMFMLAKPFKLEALGETVRHLMARRQPAD